MSGIFSSLNASSQSLAAFERAIQISQNNVNNASTPGYAAQTADFAALSFDSQSGLSGGVSTSSSSTREAYLDSAVRGQRSNLGNAQQQVQSLGGIENLFDVSGATGVPAALSALFSSFSNLSVAPASAASRAAVISAANDVAASFRQVSSALSESSAGADTQIRSQVVQVNTLASEIRGYNVQEQQSSSYDAGRDAKLNAALEKLSSLVNFSTRPRANGGTDVLLDGQVPLVLGAQQFSLSVALSPASSPAPQNPNGTPSIQILDSNGLDITGHVSGGSISGLLQFRNTAFASLRGDQNQDGEINALAKGFADRVNSLLTAGVISEGPPVQTGLPLFTYNLTDATQTAASLSVVPGFTPAQIATIDPGPPFVSNGIALSLANLARGTNPLDQINSLSYIQFFGELGGGVGRQLSAQKSSADLSQQASIQAQSLRSQLSGVSLDAEAVRLTEFQKAYSATARLIAILDQITQSTLDILR